VRIQAVLLLATLNSVLACGSDPPPPAEAPPQPAPAPAPKPVAAAPKPAETPQQSNINISDEIRRLCGITETEAFFSYDSANVKSNDRVIFKKLADCFSTGPLKGRRMRLVGHADPRGDEEYNRVLGQRRADNVKSAVSGAGLDSGKVDTTSRGEDDAGGTDEPGWSKDRRVDILAGN